MATQKQTTSTAPAPEPSQGGSYVRNADGSLTQVHQTQQATGRTARAVTAVAPGAAVSSDAGGTALPPVSNDTKE